MNTISPGKIINDQFRRVDVARALGVSESTVWRWSQSTERGTGGLIPAKYHQPLLRLAREKGIKLTADDLVHGRRVRAVAA